MTTITSRPFGTTREGGAATLYTLENSAGTRAQISNYGGTLVSLWVKNRLGQLVDVVLGYERLDQYEAADKYLGALVGRCANRIRRGRFALNGREYQLYRNDGENHLHGGKVGFDKRLWDAREENGALLLRYVSPDGEEGYPGTLRVEAAYSLTDQNELVLEYRATSDADTVCNLTNHSYFNLAGQGSGDVLGQYVQIFAECFTPADREALPLGTIASVAGTPLDFRRPVRMGERIGEDFAPLREAGGYDQNFLIDGVSGVLRPMAFAYDENSGITLAAETDLPAMQFYSGNYLDGVIPGKAGGSNGCRCGFCLESQFVPDALSHPDFAQPVLRAGGEYRSRTLYRFGVL